jgi:ankyrin repeat protein
MSQHILQISVIEGKNLLDKDRGGTSDPFVTIKIVAPIKKCSINRNDKKILAEVSDKELTGEKSRRPGALKKNESINKSHNELVLCRGPKTKVIKKTLNPVWNETFTMKFDLEENHNILFTCWDKDLIVNDFLGEIRIPASRLIHSTSIAEWFDVQPRLGRRDRVRGCIRIVLKYFQETTNILDGIMQPLSNKESVEVNSDSKQTSEQPKSSNQKSPTSIDAKNARNSEHEKKIIELQKDFARIFNDILATTFSSLSLETLERTLQQYQTNDIVLKDFLNHSLWAHQKPLVEAIRKRRNDVAHLLMKYGADPGVALCDVCNTVELDEIKFLVDEFGANVNFEFNPLSDPNGRKVTPLTSVLLTETVTSPEKKAAVIRYLIDKGADPLKPVASHSNAYQFVRKEADDTEYKLFIEALKKPGNEKYILPRYNFSKSLPRKEPLIIKFGDKLDLREFVPKHVIQPTAEELKNVAVVTTLKDETVAQIDIGLRTNEDPATATIIKLHFIVFARKRTAYFVSLWYDTEQGQDGIQVSHLALGMNPYLYYAKSSCEIDDCQYTLIYCYLTKGKLGTDTTSVNSSNQRDNGDDNSNSQTSQSTSQDFRQFCIYSYISATGHILGTNKPLLGWKYFSDELPDIEEDTLDPATYEALHLDEPSTSTSTASTASHDSQSRTETSSPATVKSPASGRKVSLDFAVANNLLLSSHKLPVVRLPEQTTSRDTENLPMPSDTNNAIQSGITNVSDACTSSSEEIDNIPTETRDPLYVCVATGTVLQLKEMLEKSVPSPNVLNVALHKACLTTIFPKVALLLKYGADPNYVDIAEGHSPLHKAVLYSSFANDAIAHRMSMNIRLLVAKGADPNAKDKNGNTIWAYIPPKHKLKFESAVKERRTFDEIFKTLTFEK